LSVYEELDAAVIKRAPGALAVLGVVASVFLPGLGHLIVGRRRRAAVFFAIDAAIAVATLWLLSRGTVGLLQLLVQPRWVRAVVFGNVAFGLFRLAAAVDLAVRERPRVNRFFGAGVVAVAHSPANKRLYVTTLGNGAGLYAFEDGGATWTPLGLKGTLLAIAVSPRDPNRLIAVSDRGDIYASRDGGLTWPNK